MNEDLLAFQGSAQGAHKGERLGGAEKASGPF